MILYFSGTGNSEYAARRIGKTIEDETVNLFEKIRDNDFSEITSQRPWVVTVPTYAWRIPHIVENWLKRTPLNGSKDIYFVMTCGGSIGNAGKYLKKLCEKKNMNYLGCAEITMPENYIALFSTPDEEEAERILDEADTSIELTAIAIKNGNKLPQPTVSLADRISSGIVNDIFYPVFVHAKKFFATDLCISCGKCAEVCPLDNVRIRDGRPVWEDKCTHCMACICRCPENAIEYGKHSSGLPRYVCTRHI